MEIPEEFKGDAIRSFFQRPDGSISMLIYDTLKHLEFYKKDKAERESKGEVCFAELIGVNIEIESKAVERLDDFDRTKRYKPGDINIKDILA